MTANIRARAPLLLAELGADGIVRRRKRTPAEFHHVPPSAAHTTPCKCIHARERTHASEAHACMPTTISLPPNNLCPTPVPTCLAIRTVEIDEIVSLLWRENLKDLGNRRVQRAGLLDYVNTR